MQPVVRLAVAILRPRRRRASTCVYRRIAVPESRTAPASAARRSNRKEQVEVPEIPLVTQRTRGHGGYTAPLAMPKMKSHSGAKKRFKKTATGKLQGRHAFSSHILEKKSPKRKREMGLDREISKADRKVVTKLLGGNGR